MKKIYLDINKDNGILQNCNWENLRNSWNVMYPNNQVACLKPDYSLLSKDYKDQK